MIAFDLECSQGHLFEAWFDSLDSFEKQKGQKLVTCPFCNDSDVRRIMSPVAVRKSHAQDLANPENLDYHRLAKEIVDYMHNNFEDVGSRFTAEALKMHYGVTEKRNIRGSATSEEEETLEKEGIDFFKIPFLKKDDEKNN